MNCIQSIILARVFFRLFLFGFQLSFDPSWITTMNSKTFHIVSNMSTWMWYSFHIVSITSTWMWYSFPGLQTTYRVILMLFVSWQWTHCQSATIMHYLKRVPIESVSNRKAWRNPTVDFSRQLSGQSNMAAFTVRRIQLFNPTIRRCRRRRCSHCSPLNALSQPRSRICDSVPADEWLSRST